MRSKLEIKEHLEFCEKNNGLIKQALDDFFHIERANCHGYIRGDNGSTESIVLLKKIEMFIREQLYCRINDIESL
jgi:hypothetical protein